MITIRHVLKHCHCFTTYQCPRLQKHILRLAKSICGIVLLNVGYKLVRDEVHVYIHPCFKLLFIDFLGEIGQLLNQ